MGVQAETEPNPNEILAELPVGVWVAKAPSGEVLYANRAFSQIMGMAPVGDVRIEEAPAVYQIVDRSGKIYPVHLLPFSRVLETRSQVTVDDLVICRRDGTQVNIRAFAAPIFDQVGTLSQVVVTFTDITLQVAAELARASTEARLALAVQHVPSVIWSVDKQGITTLSEGAGLAALGVKSGQNVFDLYPSHPTIAGFIRRGLQGEAVNYSVQVGDAAFETWIAPLCDASGAPDGFVAVSNNVTELSRLRATAMHNDRVIAIGTLAASVAHEVNNPLTYVIPYLDQLRTDLAKLMEQVPQREPSGGLALHERLGSMLSDLDTAHHGVTRIATVMRELRTFSRSDSQSRKPVEVSAVIHSVLRLVGKEVEARASLLLDLQAGARVLATDTNLSQIVLNLLMNAMQALPATTGKHHSIGIATRTDGTSVTIRISDSGPGVPEADRQRVFEPFFTSKEVGKGTGLGLFVCRNIVRDLGGEIEITDRIGGGAVFQVTLPALPSPLAALGQPQVAPAAKEQEVCGSILIIDDDARIAESLSHILRGCGHRVATACDGEQGLTLLRAGQFDVVYCDLMMSGMSGMDLAARLSAEAPALLAKVVFMTGGAFSPEARTFVAACPQPLLEKPFDVAADCRHRLRRA